MKPAEVVAPHKAPPRRRRRGLPAIVWVFLAAGPLGLLALLARGAAAPLGRRGGSAPPAEAQLLSRPGGVESAV